jgi:hypothetical protein
MEEMTLKMKHISGEDNECNEEEGYDEEEVED